MRDRSASQFLNQQLHGCQSQAVQLDALVSHLHLDIDLLAVTKTVDLGYDPSLESITRSSLLTSKSV